MAPILPHNYQPLPTSDQDQAEGEGPNSSPNVNDSTAVNRNTTNEFDSEVRLAHLCTAEHRRRKQKIQLTLIAVFVVLYMSYFLFRNTLPLSRGRMNAATRNKCYETIKQLQAMVPLENGHRNMSNAAGNVTLPTYFTLPSGDKIPSVALGSFSSVHNEAVLTAVFCCRRLASWPRTSWPSSQGQYMRSS